MATTIEMSAPKLNELRQASAFPQARRFPPLRIADRGKVRLGAQGPCFRRAAIADAGKVRLGAQGPIFR